MIGIEVFTFTTMSKMKSTESAEQGDAAAAKLIDALIKELGDWRGALTAKVGAVVRIFRDGQEVLYGIIAELR